MKGWKTIVFNVLGGILLILETQGVTHWNLNPELVAGILAIGNFILRFVTTTPVGKKA